MVLKALKTFEKFGVKTKIMEKKTKKKYDFSAISIKTEVAVQFRHYSKHFTKSNTEVLRQMMLFLKWNNLNPFKTDIDKIILEIRHNRQRIEYLIAMLKNIEKKQTKPTADMVKILFEAFAKNQKPKRVERLLLAREGDKKQIDFIANQNHKRLKKEFKEYRKTCRRILENVEEVKPAFGKPYLRINMSIAEFLQDQYTLNKQ